MILERARRLGTTYFLRCISVIGVVVDLVGVYWINKKDKRRQGSPYSHIYWPYGLWKMLYCFGLDRKKYYKHFDNIIIIFSTLRWNKTYHTKDSKKEDENIWLTKPKDRLYQGIEKLSLFSTFRNTIHHRWYHLY